MPGKFRNIFGVTGKPVLKSKSPLIFNSVFDYPFIRLVAESAQEAIETAKSIGLKGLNVTSPFKEMILKYIDKYEHPVNILDSVNTVLFSESFSTGYNTDINGIVQLLNSNEINPAGKKCLVMGAGGAAAAAVWVLPRMHADVMIWGRNYRKTDTLAKKLRVAKCRWNDLQSVISKTDIIVNCLPGGVNPFDKVELPQQSIVIDANYNNPKFSDYIIDCKIKYISGEDWLAGQAIYAYRLFTGEEPDFEMLRTAAKSPVKNNIDILALTGFMGSGKTVTGKILARELGYEFFDIDKMIEEQTGKTIPEIFETNGESYFREKEFSTIAQLYNSLNNQKAKAVIALGGGALMNNEARKIVSGNSIVTWLFSPLENCIERLNPGSRPLLNYENPVDFANRIFDERVDSYADVSDMVVNTTQEPQRTTSKIIRELNSII
jgi:shikimate dehydrogenase